MSLQQKKKLAKHFNRMKEELVKEFGDAISKTEDASVFYFNLDTLLYDCLACFIRQNGITKFEGLNRAHIGRIVEQVLAENEFKITPKELDMNAEMENQFAAPQMIRSKSMLGNRRGSALIREEFTYKPSEELKQSRFKVEKLAAFIKYMDRD